MTSQLSTSWFIAFALVAATALAGCEGKVAGEQLSRNDDDRQTDGGGTTDTKREEPREDSSVPQDSRTSVDMRSEPDSEAADTTRAADTADGGEDLACDEGFSFAPDPLETSEVLVISYSHPSEGYAYTGLTVTGPGDVGDGGGEVVRDNPPYEWRFERTVDQGGIYTFAFTSDGERKATCKRRVRDTGAPPDLSDDSDDPPDGCTCGSGEGCDRCPVVGSCFDSPSKYHPDPNKSGWECLDTAGCDGGNCKIWCPFEPCEKPEGCSNNTEICYVSPGITDYEEACRTCCESAPQNAIWNEQGHFCEEPGQ